MADELRDELPEDLDASGYVGPYKFPDNSRRRVPGAIYLVIAFGCLVTYLVRRQHDPVLVNQGLLGASILLGAVGIYSITSGWPMTVDERQGLVSATNAVGFPVGHASAQLAWRGLLSRPAWRILVYSADEPPSIRGLVELDAVDGHVIGEYTERNPEDWSELGLSS